MFFEASSNQLLFHFSWAYCKDSIIWDKDHLQNKQNNAWRDFLVRVTGRRADYPTTSGNSSFG